MYNYNLCDYVPKPEPVSSDYTVCCHYFPGWVKHTPELHEGFDAIHKFPERTPLLGYYDEKLPEVFDWQIKWAVEHGINCFVHCWYRRPENVGKPITRKDLIFEHAIHDAYYKAKYKEYMKFAIMWECDFGKAQDKDDLINNLLPFWVENYFSDNTYLKIDEKPVLFIYSVKRLIDQLGGIEGAKEAFTAFKEKIKEYGFKGIHISAIHNAPDIYERVRTWYALDDHKYIGFDSSFQYSWGIRAVEDLTKEQHRAYVDNDCMLDPKIVLDFIEKQIDIRIKYDPDYTIFTATSMLDSKPWFKYFNIDPEKSYSQFCLSPYEWKKQLETLKGKIDAIEEDSISKRVIMLDNWNEWSEGHYIAPTLGTGFKYLQAFREVFTKRDNLPDYRTPHDVGLGPYDEMWK